MGAGIDFIHHAGLIPAGLQLEHAIAQYQRLGFIFTDLTKMEATVRADLPPVYLGLGNRNAIFEHSFLEVVGAPDPDIWARIPVDKRGPFDLDARLKRYEGLHILTLGTDDSIESVRERYLAQSQPVTEVAKLQRQVPTPDGERLMQTKVLFYAQRPDPEAIVSVAQHLTPEYALQPRHMEHPNGARRMTEVIIYSSAPEQMAAKYGRYTGHAPVRRGDAHLVDMGRARILIVDAVGLEQLLPRVAPPADPGMVAFTVATPDLSRTVDYLRKQKISVVAVGERAMVRPEDGCGSAVLFEAFGASR